MDKITNFASNPENIKKVGEVVKVTIKTIEVVSDVAYQMRGSLGKIAQNFGFLKEKTVQAYSAGVQSATPPPSGVLAAAQQLIRSNPTAVTAGIIALSSTLLGCAIVCGVKAYKAKEQQKLEEQQKPKRKKFSFFHRKNKKTK